jgi:hypothetical protein
MNDGLENKVTHLSGGERPGKKQQLSTMNAFSLALLFLSLTYLLPFGTMRAYN